MASRVAVCVLSAPGDEFNLGAEYPLMDDDTMADDNGEIHPAFVAITGAVCCNSFFDIVRFGV